MKTVLAPNAPWPKYEPAPEKPKPKFKHKQKPVRVIKPKVKSKIKNTDENYERWLASERKKDAERM